MDEVYWRYEQAKTQRVELFLDHPLFSSSLEIFERSALVLQKRFWSPLPRAPV